MVCASFSGSGHGLTATGVVLLCSTLLSAPATSFGADIAAPSLVNDNGAVVAGDARTSDRWADAPICLGANDLSIATGTPSLVTMSSGSTHIPVWSLSGGTEGQSVAGIVGALPAGCAAVKVEIVVTTEDEATSSDFEDVYRVHLSQLVEEGPFTDLGHTGTDRPAPCAISHADDCPGVLLPRGSEGPPVASHSAGARRPCRHLHTTRRPGDGQGDAPGSAREAVYCSGCSWLQLLAHDAGDRGEVSLRV